jgi:ABC-type bacteriocin/lantibiotic exporter with double-glycine peptidase domain
MTDLSAGRFLAFNVAFTQLLLACLQLSSAAIAVYAAAPYYERLAPVLQTPLERNQSGIAPPLLGKIEMRDVSFGYRETPILESISLEAQQGEFVAVVGRYGSGKSTLLRLLLGFEQPQHGMILYDGHPLAGLEMQSLRRQIGAVLQNGQIMAGDILNNILGVTRLTIDDAWEAARLACIDQEIRQMPMGMHTYVSEGGTNLSGGQRQRLLLARALVTRPPILLLDEATSALDETTQAQVMQNLRDLHITRIVIAHRLSTIRDADRIYVLEAGRIAEVGTYDTLIRQNGVFASLVQG